MKKAKKIILLGILAFPFLFVLITASLMGGGSGNGSGGGTRITLTAKELAELAQISEERAEDVLLIANWQLGKEGFTLEGTSGSLAVAERESGFDPKAVNSSGGVAGYFQWSGWDNQINGNRWAAASRKELDPQVELELMSTELNGDWKHVKQAMQTSNDPKEAARIWSKDYEGVSLSDGQTKLKELEDDAEKWYNLLKDHVEHGASGIINGDFAHPFNVPYTVIQAYGQTPWSQGAGKALYPMGRHSGIDLQGKGGSDGNLPVFSMTDGVVIDIDSDVGGFYVIIKPVDLEGYLYYGHLSSKIVSEGQEVSKGQQLGTMGFMNDWHIHLEYNLEPSTIGTAGSKDIDPSPFVKEGGTVLYGETFTP